MWREQARAAAAGDRHALDRAFKVLAEMEAEGIRSQSSPLPSYQPAMSICLRAGYDTSATSLRACYDLHPRLLRHVRD